MPTIVAAHPSLHLADRSVKADEAPIARFNALLLSTIETIELWIARHEQRRQLLALPDHLMRDIGRSRADVEAEAVKRFWQA